MNEELRNNKGKLLFWWQATISATADKQRLVFIRGDSLRSLQVADGTGAQIPRTDWKLSDEIDRRRIIPEQIAAEPWLSEYQKSNRGFPIKELGISINCERGVLNIVDVKRVIRAYSAGAVSYTIDPIDKNDLLFDTRER